MEYRYEKIGDWASGSVYETWQRKDATEDWTKKSHGEFYKYEGERLWFTKPSQQMLAEDLGIETTQARANEFEAAHDCNTDVIYYLSVASPKDTGDEALKLIMGPILAELNTRNISIKNIEEVIPAKFLYQFVEGQHLGKFDRSASKAILAEIMKTTISRYDENYVEELDKLFADPKFKPTDSSEVESIVKQIMDEHPTQVQQAKENEKVAQWFIGPVMKATKGKANPQEVMKFIKQYIATA